MNQNKQVAMVSLDILVPKDHNYRKFAKAFDFGRIEHLLKKLEKKVGRTGYGIVMLFKCMLYQFMED